MKIKQLGAQTNKQRKLKDEIAKANAAFDRDKAIKIADMSNDELLDELEIKGKQAFVKSMTFRTLEYSKLHTEALARMSHQKPPYQELIGSLRAIAMIGGNLSDDRLTNRTGPNDARMRGIMYTHARKIAAEILVKAGYRLDEDGIEWVKD